MPRVTTRPVGAPPPSQDTSRAQQLIDNFGRQHGKALQLSPDQVATVNDLLSRDGGQRRAEAYLGLASAGVGLVPRNTTESRARVDNILDMALRIWAGAPNGDVAMQRLGSYARMIQMSAAGGPIMDAGVASLREQAGRTLQPFAGDVYQAGAAPLSRLSGSAAVTTSQPSAPQSSTRTTDMPVATVESIMGHAEPRLRIIQGSDAANRLGTFDKIPGTQEAWTHNGVARRLDRWMGGAWDGTKKESQILDLTHGLNLQDRVQVATSYAAIRAQAGDKSFVDGQGRPLTGEAALQALYGKLVDELDDNPLGQSKDAFVVKAQFDPRNRFGALQAHDVVMLDLKGWMENGDAIVRLLQSCSQAQIGALDAAMRQKYGKTLGEVAKELGSFLGSTRMQRRVEFLINTPRVDGQVPDAYLRAFELREAVRNPNVREIKELLRRGTTDEHQIFALLQSMSGEEFMAVAAAYQNINGKLWHDDVEGDAGQSGAVRATALYHRLYNDLNDFIGGDTLWLERLALGAEGLVFDSNVVVAGLRAQLGREPTQAEASRAVIDAELVHRDRVSRYVAVSLRLAGKNKTDQEDIIGLLGMVQAQPKPGESRVYNGMPTMYDVFQVHEQLWPEQNLLLDIDRVADKEINQLAQVVLEGGSFQGPRASALRIVNALDRGMLGFLFRSKEHVVYDVLNRPDLSPADRAKFVAAVDAEIRKLQGGKSLKQYIGDKMDRQVELPTGRSIPSAAMVLAEHGVLTPAEQLIHTIHGDMPADKVNQIIGQLTPLQKVVAMTEYARITGRVFNLEIGDNPLISDLERLKGRDLRQAAVMAQILPHDVDQLAFEIAAFLAPHTDPVIDKWVAENIGDVDAWIAANFGDADPRTPGAQRNGLAGLRDLVANLGGPAQFAANARISEAKLHSDVGQLVSDARGNGLKSFLVDAFGPHGAGLENTFRDLGAALRDAEIYRAEHGTINKDHMDRIRTRYAECLARTADVAKAGDRYVGWVQNTVLTGGIIAGMAFGVPPIGMFAIGAGASAGVQYAFGERDTVELLKHAIRGGAAGLLAGYAATQTLPAGVQQWLTGLNEGVQVAMRGIIAGSQVGGGIGATDWAVSGMEGGLQGLTERVGYGVLYGGAVGGITASLMYWGQKGWESLRGGGGETKPPVTEEPPGNTQPPIEQPGGGGPGTRSPIEQPGGPGGPGTRSPIGGPGGPGGPGTRPPVGGGTTTPVGGGTTTPVGGGTTPPVTTPTPIVRPGFTPPTGGFTPPVTTPTPIVRPSFTPPTYTPPVSGSVTFTPPTFTSPITTGTTVVSTAATTAAVTPELITAISLGWEQAAAAVAPVAVLQGMVGVQADGFLMLRSKGSPMPSTEQWQSLLRQAQASGLAVPAEPPTTEQHAVEVLTHLRQQVADRAAGLRVTDQPVPVRADPGTVIQGGRSEPVRDNRTPARITPTPHEPQKPTSSVATGTPPEPARTDRLSTGTPPEPARTAPIMDTGRLLQHPRLQDTDPKWVQQHLTGAMELLAGLEPGALANANTEQLLASINDTLSEQGPNVRNLVRDVQVRLVGFGLSTDETEIDGIVGDRTQAAFENVSAIFGPAVGGTDQRAVLLGNLEELQITMQFVAHQFGRELPSGATASEIRALMGPDGAMRLLIKDYQKLLVQRGHMQAAPEGEAVGVFDGAMLQGHVAYMQYKEDMNRRAEERQQRAQQVDTSTKTLDTYINSGVIDKSSVTSMMGELVTLRQASGEFPKARVAYMTAVKRIVREMLGGDINRATRFAHIAAPMGAEQILDNIFTQGVLTNLSKQRQAELGRAMVNVNVQLSGLPVGMLDVLDSSFMTYEGKRFGARTERVRYSDREVRDTLMAATVAKKDVHAVIKDDLDFVLSSMLSTKTRDTDTGRQALSNLATLSPDDPALKQVAVSLAMRYNGQSTAVASLIQEIAERNPAVASQIIVEAFASKKVIWEYRDGFARDLAAPRGENSRDEYDSMLRTLTPEARGVMRDNLLAGGLFNIGVTDAEEVLAAHLKTLGVP